MKIISKNAFVFLETLCTGDLFVYGGETYIITDFVLDSQSLLCVDLSDGRVLILTKETLVMRINGYFTEG